MSVLELTIIEKNSDIINLEVVEKFNPYHGKDGRFTSAGGAHTFTYAPGKSKAHDMAIEREKQRTADGIATNAKQQYTSAETSINSSKLPAVFNKVDWVSGTTNFDNGGGKFDNATEALAKKGVKNLIYDPYNRSAEHNKSVASQVSGGRADTSTISNVLNVIQEKEARVEVLNNSKNAVKAGGKVYITVYEGDGSGVGKVTSKGYQLNMKTKDYLNEVKEVFPDAKVKNGVIIATKGDN